PPPAGGGKDKGSGSRPISRVLCTLTGRTPPAPAAIPLGPGLPPGSSHLPASLGRAGRGGFRRHACLFGVAPDGGCRVSPLDSHLFNASRGLVSVALFVTSPCQGITLHPALRSP